MRSGVVGVVVVVLRHSTRTAQLLSVRLGAATVSIVLVVPYLIVNLNLVPVVARVQAQISDKIIANMLRVGFSVRSFLFGWN